MFIFTAKLSKKKLVCGLIAIGAVVWSIYALTGKINADSVRSDASDSIETVGLAAKNIKTNDDRVNYLKSCGWEVDPATGLVQEVVIPKDFDDTYEKYNELQKKQGFDLEKMKGKRVKLATYEVLNYPSGEKGVTANILIYKNKIIAGDISSANVDGFTHGLTETIQKSPENDAGTVDKAVKKE